MVFSGLNLHDLLIPFLVLLLPVYYYLVFFRSSKTNESRLPTNWPLVGMLPSLFVVNLGRFHDYLATVLAVGGGSFEMRGPPAVRFLITCDPANVRHIFVSSFGNYPKGEEFASFFDVMDMERRKQQTPGVDMEDIASHYVDERGEPREFLCATLINYTFAGRDTVAATLSWLVYNLITHPRARRACHPPRAGAHRRCAQRHHQRRQLHDGSV
jgi:hypothetical protein